MVQPFTRFRRAGEYDWDTLLKDLRAMDEELTALKNLPGGVITPPIKGDQGDKGDPGAPGAPGIPGVTTTVTVIENGETFYSLAVAYGFTGTQDELFAKILAPDYVDTGYIDWGDLPADYGLLSLSIEYSDDFGTLNDSPEEFDYENDFILTEDMLGFIIDEDGIHYVAATG